MKHYTTGLTPLFFGHFFKKVQDIFTVILIKQR